MAEIVENFFGCYLLVCENPKFKGRIYIGFTVDPNRRIRQHNQGAKAGGAWRTSNREPWVMALIVHGFPNEIIALKFEWAWQHPQKSRRLRHVQKKKASENAFEFRFRVLSELLRVGPWNRLPLIIRWLSDKYVLDFKPECLPPNHMPIVHGQVTTKKVIPNTVADASETGDVAFTSMICQLCQKSIKNSRELMTCFVPGCTLKAHLICLAQSFLTSTPHLIPVDGECPHCKQSLLWGDLVRFKKGCYQALETQVSDMDWQPSSPVL